MREPDLAPFGETAGPRPAFNEAANTRAHAARINDPDTCERGLADDPDGTGRFRCSIVDFRAGCALRYLRVD